MDVVEVNLFYPLLFTIIGLLIIVSGVVIVKCKDSNLFNNIFNRHVDEHIDTTDKFSKSHTEIVAGIPIEYQKELHALEAETEKNTELIKEILDKMGLLIERVAKLERKN